MVEYNKIGFFDYKCQENNVIYFLEKHLENFSERIALEWVEKITIMTWDKKSALIYKNIKYSDFVSKINTISAGLKSLGIQKGDRVIIFVPLSLELYLTMFAVQRIGAIAVFLDSWARKDQLGISAKVVDPKAMISFEKAFDLCQIVPELNSIALKIVVGKCEKKYSADLEQLLLTKEQVEIEAVEGKDTALITFTTGSSGVPKGANRTHRFLAAQHKALDKEIPYTDKDKDLPVFPIFSLNNLAAGVTTVLPAIDLAQPSDMDAAIVVNQIFGANVSCCTVSPSIFVNMANYCKSQGIILQGLRRVVTGGAPVSNDNVKAFKEIAPNAKILVLYGSTEVEPMAHIEADDMLSCDQTRQGVNVGKICEDLDFKLIKIYKNNIELNQNGWQEWELPKGQVGEFIVSGEHVCEGYYNNEEAFRATKIKEVNGKIWHRTGDVAFIDEQNNLWIVGRVHNTIVRNNEYLFPVHAEILLKRFDFVKQAAFLGMEDVSLGEATWAVISLKEGFNAADAEKYFSQIKGIFTQSKIPLDQIKIVDEIPLDPRHHSKVEYSKLKEILRMG